MRENSPDFSHCLFDMLELGCLLPTFHFLGFIWHQMSLELVKSTVLVSLSTTFCKAGVLDIYGDHAIACPSRGDAIARHDRIRDKIVSACSSASLSPVVEKRT